MKNCGCWFFLVKSHAENFNSSGNPNRVGRYWLSTLLSFASAPYRILLSFSEVDMKADWIDVESRGVVEGSGYFNL